MRPNWLRRGEMNSTEMMTMRESDDIAVILARLKTKPLELSEVAEVFGISNRRVSGFVDAIPGIVRIGRRVRIPLIECPPEYLADIGFLNSDKLGQSLQAFRNINTGEVQTDSIGLGGNAHENSNATSHINRTGEPVEPFAPGSSGHG
jgi:hypothetical protein